MWEGLEGWGRIGNKGGGEEAWRVKRLGSGREG